MMTKPYYPRLGNPLHAVTDWRKVRSMIRALRRGDDLPPVWIDGGPTNCNMLSGTHRAAASEIRALLDNTRPYDDLTVCDASPIIIAMTEEEREDWETLMSYDSEAAVEMIERRTH